MILLPSICDRRVLPTSAGNKCAAGMDEKTRESYVSPFGSKGDVQFPCRECVQSYQAAQGARGALFVALAAAAFLAATLAELLEAVTLFGTVGFSGFGGTVGSRGLLVDRLAVFADEGEVELTAFQIGALHADAHLVA